MSTTYQSPLSIKTWAEEDRPREKLMRQGRRSLTDAELMAILLGSGTRNESAVALSQRILAAVDHNLDSLSRMSLHQLQQFKGIGPAKAITLIAAAELGRRRQHALRAVQPVISTSADAYRCLAPQLVDLPHEEFWMLLMNRANKVIGMEHISKGGISATVVDVRLIFSRALQQLATSIILCHNHPSGNLSPSEQDVQLTRKLHTAGQSLDIAVLDHLIIAGKKYYSFADEGKMP